MTRASSQKTTVDEYLDGLDTAYTEAPGQAYSPDIHRELALLLRDINTRLENLELRTAKTEPSATEPSDEPSSRVLQCVSRLESIVGTLRDGQTTLIETMYHQEQRLLAATHPVAVPPSTVQQPAEILQECLATSGRRVDRLESTLRDVDNGIRDLLRGNLSPVLRGSLQYLDMLAIQALSARTETK